MLSVGSLPTSDPGSSPGMLWEYFFEAIPLDGD